MTVLYPDVPVWRTILDCYAELKDKAVQILLICALPYCLSLGLFILSDILIVRFETIPSLFIALPLSALVTVGFQFLAVLCLYRMYLLNTFEVIPDLSAEGFKRYGRLTFNILAFALFAFALFCLAGLVWLLVWSIVPLPFLQPFIFPAYLVVVLFYLMRISFIFPAIAVDAVYTLSDARNTTRAVSWKLLVIALFTVAPPYLVLEVTRFVIDSYFPMSQVSNDEFAITTLTWSYYVWAAFGMFLSYSLVVALVTVSAITFYIRTNWRPGANLLN